MLQAVLREKYVSWYFGIVLQKSGDDGCFVPNYEMFILSVAGVFHDTGLHIAYCRRQMLHRKQLLLRRYCGIQSRVIHGLFLEWNIITYGVLRPFRCSVWVLCCVHLQEVSPGPLFLRLEPSSQSLLYEHSLSYQKMGSCYQRSQGRKPTNVQLKMTRFFWLLLVCA